MFIRLVYILFLSLLISLCKAQPTAVKAILFDTFGTVVDWRGSMVSEFNDLFKAHDIDINVENFVEDWVNAYSDNMAKLSQDPNNFKTVDELNKLALDATLKKHHIYHHFSEQQREHMWLMWHRLKPWPDSVSGLNQLKQNYVIGTLTNGNTRLIIDLSKNAKLPWDVLFTGDLIKRYKPDPEVYLNAAKRLDLAPSQILLVASHKFDLNAAKKLGFKTAYVFRPKEFQTLHNDQCPIKDEYDYTVNGIDELPNTINI